MYNQAVVVFLIVVWAYTVLADEAPHLYVKTQLLRVPYGRSIFIDPRTQLLVNNPQRSYCRIDVLRDNPLAATNGFIEPEVFQCDFNLGDVQYTHLGSKFHTRDFVKLQLRIDTINQTHIVPFQLSINAIFTPMEIVSRNLPLVVPSVGNVSPGIGRDILDFVYDSQSQSCHVALLRFRQRLPRYGELLNVTTSNFSGTRLECNDFLTRDIRYVHKKLQSSSRDYVPFVVEITDKTLSVIKREYFQIIVRILGARVNQRPTASFQASNTLEVKDQALVAITTNALAAVDLETRDQDIIFNISKPLGNEQGQLINLDDPYRPLTAFYQEDLQHLKIAYRPPSITNGRARMFQVVLNAIDAEGAVSDPIPLLIMVKPTNVNAPIVIKNTALSLFEGQARPLTTDNLQIADNDNIHDVMLEVIGGLHHGTLRILGRPVNLFLATDLRHPDVIYRHDGSETYSDNIVFKMTDETHVVEFVFPITIAPVDDQPPYLTYSTGLLLNEGALAKVDQYMLSAADVDSDDLKIEYTIIKNNASSQPHPTPVGVLCLRSKRMPSGDLSNWVFKSDGFYEKNTTRFTQLDIMEGLVFYRHLDGEVFRDQLSFILSDNAVPPNDSPVQQFNILINKVDDLPPRQYQGSTLFVTVGESSKTIINSTVLRYTDDDSEDSGLIYTITEPPHFIDRINQTDDNVGKLILTDSGVTLTKFTQLQVNHGKVSYQAPDIEVGLIPRHAQFVFSVSDGVGNALRNQAVAVLIAPINNKAPKVNISVLQVNEFSQAIIDVNIINVFDEDTALGQIKLSFTKLPIYGVLQLDSMPLQKGQLFTLSDVFSSSIKYQHVKYGEVSDEAELVVDDGIHKKVSLLEIVINASPRNKTNTSLNITLNVKERSKETLHLPCCLDMPKNKDMKSAVQVTTPPRVGRLLLNDKTSTKFMADDVISGRVAYEHTGEETGFHGDEDQFDIVFVNESMVMAGIRYDSLKVTTHIVPVDNQPPRVFIKQPLTVREAGKAKLSQQQLVITDPDTRESDITCRIDVQPTRGYLENVSPSRGSEISNAGKRITAFGVGDIVNGHVYYVQDKHEGIEPRVDWVALSCMDINNTSPRYLLNIIILPSNDEAPHLYYRDFITDEGSELVIDVTLLNAMDDDAPLDELIFHVLTPPSHGVITDTRVEGHAPVSKFTLTQIRKSTSIVYIHDGSETTSDSLHLAVSDGVHNTSKVIPITILPIDDEVPRLVVNKGLTLRSIGESDLITVDKLRASDIDSPDDNITFIIRVEPKAGALQKLSWDGLKNLTKHDAFTQIDLKRRLIVYSHDRKMPTARDEMFFDVTDGTNTLLNQPFYVFLPNDKPIPPTVINKALKLNQGSTVTITTDFLSAHDLNSQSTKLTYTVIKQPSQGHLELSDNPGESVTSFTQLDIASNKLRYVHTSHNETASDGFDFEVADDSKRMVITRRFLITLIDVNNKKPVVTFSTLHVIEGRSGSVSPYVLRAEDKDTKPESLIFTVTRVPLHGMLVKRDVNVRQFSQADVNAGVIAYLHDGSDTTSDSLFLTVTDGTHKQFYLSTDPRKLHTEPFPVFINITAVDNRPPQMVNNKGITDLQILHGNLLGVTLDENIIKAEDRDSDDESLVYRIIKPPVNGKLTNPLSSNTTITAFTQENVNRREISYVLFPGLNVTSDAFTFSVSDPAGNTLPSQTFSIVWSRVELTQELYVANETEEVVNVGLKREGFLGGSSFVRVKLKGITARLHDDFSSFGSFHVQFSPGQTNAKWKLRVVDDSIYESQETLELSLTSPMNCVIGEKKRATITIVDLEDLPSVEMVNSRQDVKEDAGQVLVLLKRTGDLSKTLQVMCATRSDTKTGCAMGTFPSSIMSFSDYVIRENNTDSVLTMNKGQDTGVCRVLIIDDSLYEDEERFVVQLYSYHGSHVNSRHSNTEVIILPDKADEPVIEFDLPQYITDESDSSVQITIKRSGTDLSKYSTVFVRSKESEPTSAAALQDYIPISRVVHFAPYVTTQTLHVTIVDDAGIPKVEGEETFEVLLRTPINARLGRNEKTVIIINDTYSDMPIVQFKEQSVTLKEDAGLQQVKLIRHGDLSLTSTVCCYTKQETAKAGKDFTERPNTDESLVVFNPGDTTKTCHVMVTNDVIYEGEERFRLVVESTNHGSRIGGRNYTVVTIDDQEDKPVVQLDKDRLFVSEPKSQGQTTYVTAIVRRTGNPTVVHRVSMLTIDGTAKAGLDYEPVTKIILLTGNRSIHYERIKILYNKNRKIRRAFSIRLTSDKRQPTHLLRTKTTVYIEKSIVDSSVIFPLAPKVVSLRHYDDVSGDSRDIALGYPVVCVTACDPKYSRYPETGSMCDSQHINYKLTRYRWQIAESEGSLFTDITADTFFTQTNRATLDSIYLQAGIRIRCIAQAATFRGEFGLESTSQSVVIKGTKGLCLPRDQGRVGSEVFASTISFTGARNDGKANMVHLKVQIPHFDGMIPIISTRLPDIRDMLSPGAIRVAQHKCSNVLDGKEVRTKFGFLSNGPKEVIIREAEPYQFSGELRGNTTIRFYKNLNLDSCVWNFENYYHISELTQHCGASLITRENAKGLTQSQLSLRVPLYVSYVYRSKSSDWLHYDHTTFLRLTLVYDTAVLLKDGVHTPAGSIVHGSLWPTSIKIRNSDKRLVVMFKTKTKFKGTFLIKKEGFSAVGMVMSRDLPHLGFTLKMVSTQETYNNPIQQWEFTSDYAAKDYTGFYYIKLVPCLANMGISYSEPLKCHPKQPVTFNLPIRFQQIPDPVPARFTLAVRFNLMADKKLWLTGERSNSSFHRMDSAFTRDSKIYGRISLANGRQKGMGYQVYTEKVFLCSSDGEFVPSYDPSQNSFGCLEDSSYLIYRLKVLDRHSPSSVASVLGKAAFQARFASDVPEAAWLERQSDSDGFVLNSAPLFQVPRAQKWFMHAVYSVSSDPRKTKRLPRTTAEHQPSTYHHINHLSATDYLSSQRSPAKKLRTRRSKDAHFLDDGQGTNMKMIQLIYDSFDRLNRFDNSKTTETNNVANSSPDNSSLLNPLVIGVSVVCGVLLTALIVVWILYKRKGRQQQNNHTAGTASTHGTPV